MAGINDRFGVLVPEALAKRILAAQNKLLAQRNRIKTAEINIILLIKELEFFDSNPRVWVSENFGDLTAIDSYPPVTRIARMREQLESLIERRALRAFDYSDAIANLKCVEDFVLGRVVTMRRSFNWVPWPKPLPPFHGHEQVLDTGDEARTLANTRLAKEAARFHAQREASRDDGAEAGDGSNEALVRRKTTLQWPTTKQSGQIKINDKYYFRVLTHLPESIREMQDIIQNDRNSIVSGNLWEFAIGLVLTGCDWPNFHEWRSELAVKATHVNDSKSGLAVNGFINSIDNAHRLDEKSLRAALVKEYIPFSAVNLVSFLNGSAAEPSELFLFWNNLGFSKPIARNWFLKTQPQNRIFRSTENIFGNETFDAMKNSGLIASGLNIPLKYGVEAFNFSVLNMVMQKLIAKKCRTLQEVRIALIEIQRENDVIDILRSEGYENLHLVNPPAFLSWDNFQSWRMQIRVMAGVLIDIIHDDIPLNVRAKFIYG